LEIPYLTSTYRSAAKSSKKIEEIDVSTMAGHHGKSAQCLVIPTHVCGPISGYAGFSRWMKAVATITPAPKSRANRYTKKGIRTRGTRRATTRKKVAAKETTKITNKAEMRAPSRPSKLLLEAWRR